MDSSHAAPSQGAEPPATAPSPASRRAIVVLALAIPVLVSMLPLAIAPGILLMAEQFGERTAQFVLTVPAVLMILGAGLCGYLAERLGRKTVIVGALIVYAISGVAGFFATDLTPLVWSRAIGGVAAGMLLTTVYAVLGEQFAGDARERLLGFMSMAASIASVALLALMGMVVEAYGWREPFLFYGLALLLVPVALAGLTNHKAVGTGATLSWGPVLRCWPIYLLLTAYTVGMYMFVIQGPFLLNEKGITAPSTVGRLIAVSSAVGALGGAVYGLLRRRLGFRQMFALISIAIGAGMVIATIGTGTGMFIVSALVVGIGIGMIEPTVASELLLRTPEPLHDRAMGANVAAMFLGQFVNPLLVAPIAALGGFSLAFTTIGAAYLVGGVIFAVAAGALARRVSRSARTEGAAAPR